MKDYFMVTEPAEHFRVNPKTIYRRLWAKGIPAYTTSIKKYFRP